MLSKAQAALLRRVTARQADPPSYVWQGKSGAWYITAWEVGRSDTERVHSATVRALVQAGYVELFQGAYSDLSQPHYLTPKGVAALEAAKRES